MILPQLSTIRLILGGLVLAVSLLTAGCGASEYDSRFQQRGDTLRYNETP